MSQPTSFSLVRTNPLLTSNVKIVIDSSSKIYLDSFSANTELSKNQYKKFPISTQFSHATNLKRFYSNGTSANEIIFDVRREVDQTKLAAEYSQQYDWSPYFSGVKYLALPQYSEQFSYLSPLYVKEGDIPDYFIVLKVKDPVNKPLDMQDAAQSSKDYLCDILSKSSIIKTFSLKEDSNIGKYLRATINEPNYPKAPLEVSYNKSKHSYYNGISLATGTYVSVSEDLSDFFSEEHPLKYSDEYITSGFKRNNLIYPFIYNLEFLFNDETTNDYEHNRYVGFYVNESDLGSFKVDTLKLFSEQIVLNPETKIYNAIDPNLDRNLFITNTSGVELPVKQLTTSANIPSSNNDSISISYIKDDTDSFHSLKFNTTQTNEKIKLATNKINVKDFVGADTTIVALSDDAQVLYENNNAVSEIVVSNTIYSGDELIVYHNGGSSVLYEQVITKGDSLSFVFDFTLKRVTATSTKSYNHRINASIIKSGGNFADEKYSYGQLMVLINSEVNRINTGMGSNILEDIVFDDDNGNFTFSIVSGSEYIVEVSSRNILSSDRWLMSPVYNNSKTIQFTANRYSASIDNVTYYSYFSHAALYSYFASLGYVCTDNYIIVPSTIVSFSPTLKQISDNGATKTLSYATLQKYSIIVNGEFVAFNKLNKLADDLNALSGITAVYRDNKIFISSYNAPLEIYGCDGLFAVASDYDKRKCSVIRFVSTLSAGQTESYINRDNFQCSYFVSSNSNSGRYTLLTTGLKNILNEIYIKEFSAYEKDGVIYLVSDTAGCDNGLVELEWYTASFSSDNLSINGVTGDDLINNHISMMYGVKSSSIIKMSSRYIDFIAANKSELLIKTDNGYSKIRDIAKSTTGLNDGTEYGFAEYNGKIVLSLEEQADTPLLSMGKITMYYEYKVPFGEFEMYEVRDLDFDFYSSRYTKEPYYERFRYYTIPPDTENSMQVGVFYKVIGSGVIEYCGYEFYEGAVFSCYPSNIAGYDRYSVKVGDCRLIRSSFNYWYFNDVKSNLDPNNLEQKVSILGNGSVVGFRENGNSNGTFSSYTSDTTTAVVYIGDRFDVIDGDVYVSNNLSNPPGVISSTASGYLADQDKEFVDFAGLSVIKDPNYISQNTDSKLYDIEYKFSDGKLSTEYDYLKENYTTDFAFRSKSVPTTCKWAYIDGLDCRDNPYRLNSSLVFGFNNFAPAHNDYETNPNNFTNEWYYVISDIIGDDKVMNDNYNIIPRELLGGEQSLSDLLASEPNALSRLLTYSPNNGIEQKRYSTIRYNSDSGFCETFFKGAKIRFKEDSLSGLFGSDKKPLFKKDSKFLDNYKFSVILEPIREDIISFDFPISMNFIKDDEFVVLHIKIALPSSNLGQNKDNLPVQLWIDARDYRFDDLILDYTSMYAFNHKKRTVVLGDYSTVKIPYSLFINSGSKSLKLDNYYANRNCPILAKIFYPESSADSEMIIRENTSLTAGDSFKRLADDIDPKIYVGRTDNYVNVDYSNLGCINMNDTNGASSVSGLRIKNSITKGGKGYLKRLFSAINFANIKDFINNYDDFITYDGNNFYCEILPSSEIKKTSILSTKEITNNIGKLKPDTVIGYEFIETNTVRPYYINRYEGGFEPITNNVLYLKDGNKKFNPVFDFGLLKNFVNVKYSDKSILSLTGDKEFTSQYELVGEYPLDHNDISVLSSSWDIDFYKNYTSKHTFVKVAGSLSTREDDTFINNVMKVPNAISVYNAGDSFAINTVAGNKIGNVDVKALLVDKIIVDGDLVNRFKVYVPDNKDYIGGLSYPDYVREYVGRNLVELYGISTIEVYLKKVYTDINEFSVVSLSESDLLAGGFSLTKDIGINKTGELSFGFNYKMKVGFGSQLGFIIKINRI